MLRPHAPGGTGVPAVAGLGGLPEDGQVWPGGPRILLSPWCRLYSYLAITSRVTSCKTRPPILGGPGPCTCPSSPGSRVPCSLQRGLNTRRGQRV